MHISDMTNNSPRQHNQGGENPYLTKAHIVGMSKPSVTTREAPKCEKENRYYMDNYEATVTVHKSPPQQRRQFFDYLEIDDETRDSPHRTSSTSRLLSKRKNLKVTFSDHIDVDFIRSSGDDLSDDDVEFDDDFDDVDGIVEETVYEIPFDRTKGLKQITSSAEFKTVTEHISPTSGKGGDIGRGSSGGSGNKSVLTVKTSPNMCPHQKAAQGLLQKRRTITSLSDLEKKTKDYVIQLQEKTKRAETQARVARAMFPDIATKVKSQSNYKQFIANAKRAVEITRKYERPWVNGATATQSTFSVWKKKSEHMRRTASLPRNFKLPDDLTRRPVSENILLTGGARLRIKNT